METRLVNPHACQYVQSRLVLDPVTVADYAEMLRNEINFEPCQAVITPAGDIIIYDGNHRAAAAKRTAALLEVALTPGTAEDAEWLAAGANTRHGLRRSADDIAKAVHTALRHARAQGKSDREIARHCGCDHKTVGKYRKALEASGERPQIDTRTVQRNGTAYQMTIPMPVPPQAAAPEPARQVSVFVPDEKPQIEHRHGWKCTSCQKNIISGWGTFYGDGRQVCAMCKAVSGSVSAKIRCEQCGKFWPSNQIVEHEGRKLHTDCYYAAINQAAQEPSNCTACGEEIAPGAEATSDGKPYHPMCHYRIAQEQSQKEQVPQIRCAACGKEIHPGHVVEHGGRKWHVNCYHQEQAQPAANAPRKDDSAEIALEHLELAIQRMTDAQLHRVIKLAKHELTRRHQPAQEGGHAAARKYAWPDGKVLEVKAGIGSGGYYMTMWRKPDKMSWKRFVRPALPVRQTRREAQEDLDAFAQAHALPPAANDDTAEDTDEDTDDADTD